MNHDNAGEDDLEASYGWAEHYRSPPEAEQLAGFLERWLEDVSEGRTVAAAQFELARNSVLQDLRAVIARHQADVEDKEDLAGDLEKRIAPVEHWLGMWIGACEHEPEQAALQRQPLSDHTRGLIAWLRDLELPCDAIRQTGPPLPRVVTMLQVRDKPPGLQCGNETMDVMGQPGALEAIKVLCQDPSRLWPLSDLAKELAPAWKGGGHALEGQVSRLKKQMIGVGGHFAEVAAHLYLSQGKFGFRPQARWPRRSRPR